MRLSDEVGEFERNQALDTFLVSNFDPPNWRIAHCLPRAINLYFTGIFVFIIAILLGMFLREWNHVICFNGKKAGIPLIQLRKQ